MPSEYEQAISNQAIYSISRITAPENPAANLGEGVNGIDYASKGMYEGKASIADIVKGRKDPVDIYSNPVKAMSENNPQKDIYASLLNYKFMN